MPHRLYKSCFKICALLLSVCACATHASQPERFAIYYNDKTPPAKLKDYELLVLAANQHPDLAQLQPQQLALAYISIGEAPPGHLTPAQQDILAIREHPYWKSQLIDIRHPDWQHHIVNELVPQALAKGFDGVMLDTVDSPLHLETTEPKQYNGMHQAAITLIEQIRVSYPEILIMLNRGFEIWPDVAPSVDMLLVESILSHYNLKDGKAKLAPDAIYTQQLERIQSIKALFPHLRVYSVDYWNMKDKEGVALLYDLQRKNGLIPYVTTPSLDAIHPEPMREGNA